MCAAEKRAQVCEEFQFRSGNTVRDTNGFLIRRALCGREIHTKDKDMNAPRTRTTTTKTTTTTACQMCDIALEYDALSAEFLASRKVQCGRCTFVNDIVEKEEKTTTKMVPSTRTPSSRPLSSRTKASSFCLSLLSLSLFLFFLFRVLFLKKKKKKEKKMGRMLDARTTRECARERERTL